MSDNYTFKDATGSTTTAAADEIASAYYQRVKISQGADGSATDVSSAAPLNVTLENTGANATAVKVDGSAVTQPVSLASVPSHAVTNAGTFAVQAAQSGTWSVRPDSYATDDTAMPATPLVVPVGAEYRSSATTYADGDATVLQSDVNGNLKVTLATLSGGEDLTNNISGTIEKPLATNTYANTLYAPLTQVTKANLKASAGNVFSIYITNDNAAVRYFQLHNKASAPAGTDVPLISLKIPAGTANNPGVLQLDHTFFSHGGRYFSTGIGWAVSTTFGTFTDSATNTEHIVVIQYA